MHAFIGFDTSEYIWLRAAEMKGRATTATPSERSTLNRVDLDKAREMLPFLPPEEPLHLIMPERSCVRVIPGAQCHIWNGPIKGSYRTIGNGLHLSTPEACWRQMAGVHDVVGAVLLGYRLCATYIPLLPFGVPWVMRQPLTTPERLEAFLARTDRGRGCATAREALHFIASSSASPRETAIALLLSLPRRLGGYGLPVPILNARIPLGQRGQSLANKDYFVADLFWPEQKVCVEYDSDMFHSSQQRAVMDSTKRNALSAMGYTVVTLTNAQVKDAGQFDKAARSLAIHLRIVLRIRSEKWLRNHILIRQRLLV